MRTSLHARRGSYDRYDAKTRDETKDRGEAAAEPQRAVDALEPGDLSVPRAGRWRPWVRYLEPNSLRRASPSSGIQIDRGNSMLRRDLLKSALASSAGALALASAGAADAGNELEIDGR